MTPSAAVELVAPTLEDLTQIALAMRAADAAEIFAVRPEPDTPGNRAGLAVETLATVRARGLARVVRAGGAPAAVIGAVELWPGRWSGFAYATDAWPRVWRAASDWALGVLGPAVIAAGARRVEVQTAAWRTDVHRWLARLGAACEGRHAAYARDGTDYLTFAWTELPDVRLFRAQPAAAAPAAAADAGRQRRQAGRAGRAPAAVAGGRPVVDHPDQRARRDRRPGGDAGHQDAAGAVTAR